jgi:O-antigen/teichoic acid export membrane protein
MVVGVVFAGLGIAGVVWGTVAANALGGAGFMVAASTVSRRRWQASWLRSRWSDLTGHGRDIARFFVFSDLTELVGVLTKSVDVLLLGAFRPAIEIGYYNLGKSLVAQLSNLVAAIRAVAFPDIMRLWQRGEWTAMWTYVRRHTLVIGVPAAAGVAALMVALPGAISLVYGDEFLAATSVARVMLAQVLLLLLSLWIGLVVTAWGDVHVRLLARLAGVGLMMAIIAGFGAEAGTMAGAVALLAQQALSVIVMLVWVYARRVTRATEARSRRDSVAPAAPAPAALLAE